MKKQIDKLLKEWHEACRAQFEREYPALNYDKYAAKTSKEGRRWINLDEGSSGAFMVDKTDGQVYRLKSAYGVPNFRKRCGHIDTITGAVLNRLRWW